MNVDYFKNYLQYASLALSLFFNTLLTFLVIFKSPPKMGTYKYLIIYFCSFSSVLSIIEASVNPFMISVDTVFVVGMNTSNKIIKNKDVARFLVCITCGCFGTIIALIAIHFIFRYFAIQRKGNLKYFRGKYFWFWCVIPILYGVVWAGTTYIFLNPSDNVVDIVREYFKTRGDIDIDNIVFIAGNYFTDDSKQNFNFSIFPGTIIYALLMTSCLFVVFYFGSKIYLQIDKLEDEGRSDYTKKLQKQLFKALVLQTICPLLLLHLPVVLFLFLPAFNIQQMFVGQIFQYLYAIYPVIDPLPTILIVDNYRNALTECIRVHNRVGEDTYQPETTREAE